MLAAYLARTGAEDPLDNLEVGERPTPEPRPGWSLLKVEAASLNHHDLWLLRGVSAGAIRPPQVLGTDAAGTVAAHGPGVTHGRTRTTCAFSTSCWPRSTPSLMV